MGECDYEVCWHGATWRQDRVIVQCPEPTPETKLHHKNQAGYEAPRPTSVAILECLKAGSFTSADISKRTGFSLSAVHRNLNFLVKAGDVEVRYHRGGDKNCRFAMMVYRLAAQDQEAA
jgi:hypothetical protein